MYIYIYTVFVNHKVYTNTNQIDWAFLSGPGGPKSIEESVGTPQGLSKGRYCVAVKKGCFLSIYIILLLTDVDCYIMLPTITITNLLVI